VGIVLAGELATSVPWQQVAAGFNEVLDREGMAHWAITLCLSSTQDRAAADLVARAVPGARFISRFGYCIVSSNAEENRFTIGFHHHIAKPAAVSRDLFEALVEVSDTAPVAVNERLKAVSLATQRVIRLAAGGQDLPDTWGRRAGDRLCHSITALTLDLRRQLASPAEVEAVLGDCRRQCYQAVEGGPGESLQAINRILAGAEKALKEALTPPPKSRPEWDGLLFAIKNLAGDRYHSEEGQLIPPAADWMTAAGRPLTFTHLPRAARYAEKLRQAGCYRRVVAFP
jgi:hypothetical protein